MGVRNYLVEGVSCAGKTTVAEELARRGHQVIHGDRELAYRGDPITGTPIDDPGSDLTHEQHLWDVDQVRVLAADDTRPLTFFCGGSRNFARFIHLFDAVFVLDLDHDTLLRRLSERPAAEWGGRPEQQDLVLRLRQTKEDVPDGIMIDSTAPVERVVDAILRHCGRDDHDAAGDDQPTRRPA